MHQIYAITNIKAVVSCAFTAFQHFIMWNTFLNIPVQQVNCWTRQNSKWAVNLYILNCWIIYGVYVSANSYPKECQRVSLWLIYFPWDKVYQRKLKATVKNHTQSKHQYIFWYLDLGPPVSPWAWGKQGAGTLGTSETPCTWSALLSF